MSLDFLADENGGSPHSSLEDTEKAAKWLENTLKGTLTSADNRTGLTSYQIRCIFQRVIERYDKETGECTSHE
jgi:hypothetical protein